ncbi:hypothetical protein ACF0H5_015615 [Mactra antiquata]
MYPHLTLISFLAYHIFTVVDGKLPDLATLCPYNDFCTTKATKTLSPSKTGLMPCCQRCSCEPDCELFGNCCPDKELTPEIQVKYPCVSLDEYYNAPRAVKIRVATNVFYHIIDDCPSVVHSIQYPRCSVPRELEDYVFVSDVQTGRVYKNTDCAKCNGVKQYAEWQMATDCRTQSETLSREEWYSHILTSCVMTPVLLDSTISQDFRCYPKERYVEKCNSTGTWKNLDSEIQDACELENSKTNDMYYHAPIQGLVHTFAYQTAFCKLCNPLEVIEWSDLCVNILSPLYDYKSMSFMAFSVIINFVKAEETSLVPQCKQDQIWDPYKEVCVSVTCPVSSSYLNGKCEDMYKRLPGLTYDIFFRITSSQNEFSIEVLKDMHDTVTDVISNTHCYQCSSQIFTEHGTSNVYLIYLIQSTKRCPEAYLLRKVKQMARNQQFHSNLSPNITFVLDFSATTINMKRKGSAYIVNTNCGKNVRVDQKMIDRCPRIPLAYLELNVTDNDLKTERDGSLCLQEYFEIMRSRSRNSSNRNKQAILVTNVLTIIAFVAIRLQFINVIHCEGG